MHDFPRQKLAELISRHGTIISEDAKRCESLLRNACGDESRREIFVLINAIKEGVVKELLSQPLPDDKLINSLAQQLHNNLWLDKVAANWAVESWDIALKSKDKSPQPNQPVIEKTEEPQPAAKLSKRFFPLNPLDYLHLLWWVLVMPQQLQAYREVFGNEDEKRLGNWLISSLIWWPLLLPTLALGLELWPHSPKTWLAETYLSFSLILFGSWFLTGYLKLKKNVTVGMAIFVSALVAILVSVDVAGIMAGSLTNDLLIGIAMIMATFIMIFVAIGMAVVIAGDVAIIVAGIIGIGVAVGVAIGSAILMSDFVVGFVAGSVVGIVAGFMVDFMTNTVGDAIENSLKTGIPSMLASLVFSLLIIDLFFLLGLYIFKWYSV